MTTGRRRKRHAHRSAKPHSTCQIDRRSGPVLMVIFIALCTRTINVNFVRSIQHHTHTHFVFLFCFFERIELWLVNIHFFQNLLWLPFFVLFLILYQLNIVTVIQLTFCIVIRPIMGANPSMKDHYYYVIIIAVIIDIIIIASFAICIITRITIICNYYYYYFFFWTNWNRV